MTILDTDTITHYSYGNANVVQKLKDWLAANPSQKLAVTIITSYELIKGRVANLLNSANDVELKAAIARFRATEALLADFQIIHLDDTAASHFEQLRKQKKLKMHRPDMLIACIALANNAVLVTRNTKDYQGVQSLQLDNWVD
jgi:tRNA(fMet)-specific endonuclease VapC